MLQTIRGLVLRTRKYTDTSVLAEVYTDVYGHLTFVVPLSRSRHAAVKSVLFQPLSLLELTLDYRSRLSMQKVREARVLVPFLSIPYDAVKSAIALFLSDFLQHVLRHEPDNKLLFEFLSYSVSYLDVTEQSVANFHLLFMLRLLRFVGVEPNMEDYCKGCWFDFQNACFVATRPLDSVSLSPSASRVLYFLSHLSFEQMHHLHLTSSARSECVDRLLQFYQFHIPGFAPLKSLQILKELFN